MASWQAHLTAWILRKLQRPRLARAKTALDLRRLMKPPPFVVPPNVKITAAAVAGIPGEWVEASEGYKATLLYIHGGGYLAMSAKTHRPITAGFARRGFRVFAPDYRLAPENPFPAAIEDVVKCYRGILSEETDERNLTIAGDSSGGGLSVALLLSLRNAGISLPSGCVLFSPWTDLAATGASILSNNNRCSLFVGDLIAPWAKQYLGDVDARNPLASPLYADLSGLPPLLIHVGEAEVLLDDSVRLAERVLAAGSPATLSIWPVVPHDWQLVPLIPEARQSLDQASEFLHCAIEQRQNGQ
jgi:monoterpene epsilon-lactone hydrolase